MNTRTSQRSQRHDTKAILALLRQKIETGTLPRRAARIEHSRRSRAFSFRKGSTCIKPQRLH